MYLNNFSVFLTIWTIFTMFQTFSVKFEQFSQYFQLFQRHFNWYSPSFLLSNKSLEIYEESEGWKKLAIYSILVNILSFSPSSLFSSLQKIAELTLICILELEFFVVDFRGKWMKSEWRRIYNGFIKKVSIRPSKHFVSKLKYFWA